MPIIQGKDHNFFQKVSVTPVVFPDVPQVIINVKYLSGLSLQLETNSVIEYSFNGTTTHGDMIAGFGSSGLFFENRPVSQIWFKVISGANPATVRVEAW